MISGNTLDPVMLDTKEILIMESHRMLSSIEQKPILILILIMTDVLEHLLTGLRNLQEKKQFLPTVNKMTPMSLINGSYSRDIQTQKEII